jgi:phage terminase large subunit
MGSQRNSYATINKAFEPFMVDEHRYNVLWGSAGSGKSAAAAQKIIIRCITEMGTPEEPFRHIFTVVRKYKTTIRGTVFEQIKSECVRMGINEMMTINESYGVFKFWNGAEIRCIGLDDPEKIKSLVSTGCWIEEATELEEMDFAQLDLRFRGESPYYKQLILTFNPISETHWIKYKFFDTAQNGMTYTLHSTYKDNYFLDAQYVKLLEENVKHDPNMYRIYVQGLWGRIMTGSEFYFNFKPERHVKEVRYIEKLPLHISFDFNVNPFISAVVIQMQRRDIDDGAGNLKPYYFINVLDEFALPNPYNTTERLCDDIRTRYESELRGGLYLYGDASGNAKTTRSNISDYDIIEHILGRYMNNYSNRVPKANPQVRKRRWFINKAFFGGFNLEINVHPRCKKLIGDFENCIEAEDGSIHKQTARDKTSGVVFEKFGHHADAFSYFMCAAFENHYESSI